MKTIKNKEILLEIDLWEHLIDNNKINHGML